MNRARIITLIILLTMHANYAIAAERPARFEKPEDVVAWLYRDFGWEALIIHYFDDIINNQPKNVLQRYFTSQLTELIMKDRQYEIRTKEIGHVNFMLLFYSQDPDGISNIRINRLPGTNMVLVLYDYNGVKDIVAITYETVQAGDGWRISDIRYKARKTSVSLNPAPEVSLLNLLKQPY